jgi:hypothetical protein
MWIFQMESPSIVRIAEDVVATYQATLTLKKKKESEKEASRTLLEYPLLMETSFSRERRVTAVSF